MTWLRVVISRITGLFRKGRLEQDLDEDVRMHIEMLAEDNQRKGMAPEEAPYAALRTFGGVEQVKEECRDSWGVRYFTEFSQDLHYCLRQLRGNPGFMIVAALTLALGIGANTGIFSLAEGVLFPPFVGAKPSRLAAIYTSGEHGSGYASTSYPDFLYYREHSRTFSGIAAFVRIEAAWTHNNTTELPWGEIVSGNYFDVLGIKPFLGRFFLPSGESVSALSPVAVVSYRFWREQMASTQHPLGQSLLLNGKMFTVIGVAPEGFEGVQLNWGGSPEFWLPMSTEPNFLLHNYLDVPSARWCLMVGRLRPGATIAKAGSEVRLLASQLEQVYPEADKGRTASLMPFNEGRIWPAWRAKIKDMVWLLGFFSGLVLLVACADVANLLLARGASRQKEVGVRLALGASRARIVRLLLTEGLLLSLAGAGVGLLLAWWMGQWMTKFGDMFTVRLNLHPPSLDIRVLLFTTLLAILAALVFGLAPAFQVSDLDLNTSLKESGPRASSSRHHQWLRQSLVVAAVSVAFIAVAGSVLLVHTLWKLDSTDLGLDPHNVLSISTEVFTRQYKPDAALGFYSQLLDRIRSLPGVQSAALAFNSPLTMMPPAASVAIADQATGSPETWRKVDSNVISPDYFKTLHIPLPEGRDFTNEDDPTSSVVVIVNQKMARIMWGHNNPIGKHLLVKGAFETGEAEVVGVAADAKQESPWESDGPFLYQPASQARLEQCQLLVRTYGDPMAIVPAIRQQMAGLDPRIPLYGAESMEQIVADTTAEPRMAASLVSLFGVLVLLLAVAGIYGVLTYWVAQRRHEIGIRMALGAQKKDVLNMVIGHGLKLTLAAIPIGIAGALVVTRFLSSLLYGVKPTDVMTFVVVSLLLTVVALVACYIPARRATKVDPMMALRHE